MGRQRGRPRELPEGLVYLRLAVTPVEHRMIQVAAALAGESMAQYARQSVTEAARRAIRAAGLDPERLPAPAAGGEGDEAGDKGTRGRRPRRRKKEG